MNGDAIFTVIPLLSIIFYIAPIVFIIWFLFKFLKLQQEKNIILRNISEKLEKQNNSNS